MWAVMLALPARHLFDGHYAAFELGAIQVLELDGGVADVEAIPEQLVEPGQDAAALRRRNVGDGHVAG